MRCIVRRPLTLIELRPAGDETRAVATLVPSRGNSRLKAP